MGVLQKIKQKIRRKPDTFITKIPQTEFDSETKEFINNKLEAENAELKAQNLKYKTKEESKKKEKDREKQLQRIVDKESFELKKERDLIKERRTFKIKFMDGTPGFNNKSRRNMGNWLGIILKETGEGTTLWYPWLENKGKQYKLSRPVGEFGDFFQDKISFVSQLKSGIINSNYDVTEKGQLVLKFPKYEDESGEKIKIKDVSDSTRKEYEDIISQLKDQLGSYANYVETAKNKEVDYEIRLADAEIKSRVSDRERDIYAGKSAIISEQKAEQTQDLVEAQSTGQELKTQQILESRYNRQLLGVVDDLMKKHRYRFSQDAQEYALTQLTQIVHQAVGAAMKMSASSQYIQEKQQQKQQIT